MERSFSAGQQLTAIDGVGRGPVEEIKETCKSEN